MDLISWTLKAKDEELHSTLGDLALQDDGRLAILAGRSVFFFIDLITDLTH